MDNRQSAEAFLNKNYNNPATEDIDHYLDVVKRLKRVAAGFPSSIYSATLLFYF